MEELGAAAARGAPPRLAVAVSGWRREWRSSSSSSRRIRRRRTGTALREYSAAVDATAKGQTGSTSAAAVSSAESEATDAVGYEA